MPFKARKSGARQRGENRAGGSSSIQWRAVTHRAGLREVIVLDHTEHLPTIEYQELANRQAGRLLRTCWLAKPLGWYPFGNPTFGQYRCAWNLLVPVRIHQSLNPAVTKDSAER
jgi:hypothetical protein